MARNFGHEDAGLATDESLRNIVRTNSIDNFLDSDDKRYLVGPKGTGKTLLLLRKAINQRRKGDSVCIPSEADLPVDRMTTAEHVGRKFNHRFKDPSESSLAWASVWKHAIYRSVLHHVCEEIQDHPACGSENEAKVKALLAESTQPRRPSHYYAEIGAKLDSAPKPVLRRVRDEIMELEDLLRMARSDVYVFLDNLDDYYERDPGLWLNSMYGQFRAVREISLTHRKIHLFTSLRKDVYAQFKDEMYLQYYDYVAELKYSQEELLEIFESGIRQLNPGLLGAPDLQESDPWRAFFGDCVLMPNPFVGVDEDVRSYVYRHTLGRPRDMIHMGTVLLQHRSNGGFDVDSVRRAVATAAEHIRGQYLNEVRPLIDARFDIREFVSQYCMTNIFTPEDLDAHTLNYAESRDAYEEPDRATAFTDPFAALHDLGLLGVAKREEGAVLLHQRFNGPGRGLGPEGEPRRLPEACLYFLHPVLNSLLPAALKSNQMVVGYHYDVVEAGLEYGR